MDAFRLNLAELDLPDLEILLEQRAYERFHARQLYRWIYKRGVTDFEKMTDLSKEFRARLARDFEVVTPRIVSDLKSIDGTRKFVLELADQRRIEAVFIPDTPAMTFCISTQVGCAMSCGFCLTGKMGLLRNLTAGEIAAEVRVLAAATNLLDHPFNIVLMGMGEPLHNYDNTMKALRMLHNENGLAVSPRRVTLSTVGIVPGLQRLAHEPLMPNLAISLHATTDEQRTELVPPNRKYPLAEILEVCRRFPLKRRSRITFEYVLLAAVNDTPEDARRLAKLLSDIKAKVNLIPLNPAPGIPYERPSDERVDRFAQILADRHLTVSVRKSRGQDIRAACGQLIVEGGVKKSAAQQMALLMP
ncbi:MAG TPA: 23S rRNA (adenine(2503)-C(2))-methyltransferase RlmN [Vicinamibacterales bacterium]|jgi:23S rRNA (adenine2503-C2)-methyltransferase|nr:23S rRNA (adenine(2503)-C(2))-methyltransferase RlmN [Vicinamibacterales bacterium]